MKLPNPDEYQSAVQNPRIAFSDPELKTCIVEKDPLGLPRPQSGGFAVIYHLCGQGHEWAVRCFYRDIPDLQKRYEVISRFLERHAGTIFVDAKLLSQGILIRGQWYPIIKMPWLRGNPLSVFIERNVSNHTELSWLPSAFLDLVKNLENMQVAHGDLQHGNIMVTDHTLRLVDYDGMYLSELAGLTTNQIGHINYQHPLRDDNHFDLKIDRFSEIVVYTALQAIVANPKLWRKYSNSENLLFKRDDFTDPESSELLTDLKKIPKLEPVMKNFRSACYLRFDEIPSLEDFVSGRVPIPIVIPVRPGPEPISREPFRIPSSQYEVVEAEDITTLLNKVGYMVQVVGRMTAYHRDYTKDKKLPYVFLNFGDWRKKCFTLVIWSEALELFSNAGISIPQCKGKWVSVTGIITEYKGRPQIQITIPSQIELLPIAEDVKTRVRKGVQLSHVCYVCGSPTNTFDIKGGRAVYVCPKCAQSQTYGGPTTPARAQRWHETPAIPLSSRTTIGPPKTISTARARSNEAAVLQGLYGKHPSTSPSTRSTMPQARLRSKLRAISIPSFPKLPTPLIPSGKISRIALSLVLILVSFLGPFYASQVLVVPTAVTYSVETKSVYTTMMPTSAYSIRTITRTTTSTTSYERKEEEVVIVSVITTRIVTTESYLTYRVVTVTVPTTVRIETTRVKTFAETYPMAPIALSVGIGTFVVLSLVRTQHVQSLRQAHATLSNRFMVLKRWLLRLWSSLEKMVH